MRALEGCLWNRSNSTVNNSSSTSSSIYKPKIRLVVVILLLLVLVLVLVVVIQYISTWISSSSISESAEGMSVV